MTNRERKRRGNSLKGLGLTGERKSNGLISLAGQWSAEELEAFERAVGDAAEKIDEEIWR